MITNTLKSSDINTNKMTINESLVSNNISVYSITADGITTILLTMDSLTSNDTSTFNNGTILTSPGLTTPTIPLNYFNSTSKSTTVTYTGGSFSITFYFQRLDNFVTMFWEYTPFSNVTNSSLSTTLQFTDTTFLPGSSNPVFSALKSLNNTSTEDVGFLSLQKIDGTSLLILITPTKVASTNWNGTCAFTGGSITYLA